MVSGEQDDRAHALHVVELWRQGLASLQDLQHAAEKMFRRYAPDAKHPCASWRGYLTLFSAKHLATQIESLARSK